MPPGFSGDRGPVGLPHQFCRASLALRTPLPRKVFGFEARLCAPNVTVEWDADFNPTQGGKCIAHKLTPTADAKLEAIAAAPFQSVDAQFHVGAGRDTYTVQGTGPTTIDCSPGRTCQLVLKIQVPNGFGFRSQTVTVA